MEDSTTIEELKGKCVAILDKRKLIDEAKQVYSALNEELDAMEIELLAVLEKNDMKSFKESGMNFISTELKSITTPKGDDKLIFFDYLKETGHFDALVSVNSRSLMSWYREEDEKARARGEPYAMIPGLALPTTRPVLSIRKS